MTAVRLQHLAKLNTEVRSTESRSFIALENLESWTGSIAPDVDLPMLSPPQSGAASVEIGDVLFGKLRPYLAKTWLADRPAYASTELLCLCPHAGIDSRWFAYLMGSSAIVEWARATSDGTKMPRTSWDRLREFKVMVPSVAEQAAIADYLDRETARIDSVITGKRRLLDLLDERLRAEIDGLIWAGNPNTIALGRIAKRIDVGIAEAATHAYADAGVPLLRSTNIRPNRIDVSDLLHIQAWFAEKNKSKTIFADDILTVRTGNAGVSAITPPELAGAQCFTQLITTIRQPNSAAFYCYALNSGPVRAYFQSAGWGSAQDNISVPILSRAPVPLLDPRKQRDVVGRIRTTELSSTSAVKLLRRQISLLGERRHRLIESAISGEIPSGVSVA